MSDCTACNNGKRLSTGWKCDVCGRVNRSESVPAGGSARSSHQEPFRLTVVIEYPNSSSAPAIGRQPCLGGTIVAIQFSDALTEIERCRTALEEIKTNTLNSDPEHWVAVKALQAHNDHMNTPRKAS